MSEDVKPTRPVAATIGRYRVVRALSLGRPTQVLEVEHAASGRRYALKISVDAARQPTLAVLQRNEARALHEVRDPHVVGLHEVGEHDGMPYLVLDLIDGVTLDRFVDPEPILPTLPTNVEPPRTTTAAQRVRLADPARIRRVVSGVAQAARALRALHARAIVHRDVQPAHLLVDAHGFLTLVDLSLVGRSPIASESGIVIGTLQFLSPEQALAQPVDTRADLYALGVVLYMLLTGRHPFYSENAVGYAYHHARKPPLAIEALAPDAPHVLRELAMRLLAKNPDHRPAHVDEVTDILERFDPDAALLAPVAAHRDAHQETADALDDVDVVPPARRP